MIDINTVTVPLDDAKPKLDTALPDLLALYNTNIVPVAVTVAEDVFDDEYNVVNALLSILSFYCVCIINQSTLNWVLW